VFVAKTAGGVRVAVTGRRPLRVPRQGDGRMRSAKNFSSDAIKDIKVPATG